MTKQQELLEAQRDLRKQYRDGMAEAIRTSPKLSYEAIARDYAVSVGYVYKLAREYGIRREADAVQQEAVHD